MDRSSSPGRAHPVSPGHAGLVGGMIAIVLCLIFWATAAAKVLPLTTPAPIRTFTPAAGVSHLLVGLCVTGVVGAILWAVGAGVYNLALHASRRTHETS
jgi:hypothetical protein